MKSIRFATLLFLLSLFASSCKKDEAPIVNTFSVKINGVLRELSGDDKVISLAIRSNNKLIGVLVMARFSETELMTLSVRQQDPSAIDDSFITYTSNLYNEDYHGSPKLSPVDLQGKTIQGTFEANLVGSLDPGIILTEGKFHIKRPQQ